MVGRHATISQVEPGDAGPAQAQRLLPPADGQAGRFGGDGECAEPLRACGRVCGGEHDEDAGDAAVADPRLGAVQHVFVPLARGAGAQPGRVAARARLGERERADALARGHLRQQAFFCRVAAMLQDGPRRQGVVHVNDQGRAGALSSQRFQQQGEGGEIQPGAAVRLLGQQRAQEALRRHPLQEFGRHPFLLVGLIGHLGHLFGREVAEHLLEHLLFGGKGVVHGRSFLAGIRGQGSGVRGQASVSGLCLRL